MCRVVQIYPGLVKWKQKFNVHVAEIEGTEETEA